MLLLNYNEKERRDNMIKLNDNIVKITRFPDNTFKFDIDKSKVRSCNKVQWNFESMEELFTLIGLADKLKNTSTSLFIPYLPKARMDKVQNQNEGFMLKYFVEIVDSLGFDKILLLDPHSEVYKQFTKKTEWIGNSMDPLIKDLVLRSCLEIKNQNSHKDVTLVYPDKGARARYTGILGENKNLVGVKVRNQSTGEIISFELLGEIPDGPVLIVDDICSYGGTPYFTAEKLREKGYSGKIYLYVTHAEDSIFKGKLLEEESQISGIFTTNSIFKGSHEKITVYSI